MLRMVKSTESKEILSLSIMLQAFISQEKLANLQEMKKHFTEGQPQEEIRNLLIIKKKLWRKTLNEFLQRVTLLLLFDQIQVKLISKQISFMVLRHLPQTLKAVIHKTKWTTLISFQTQSVKSIQKLFMSYEDHQIIDRFQT